MISGSLCRHLKIAGRFVIEAFSLHQPNRLNLETHPYSYLLTGTAHSDQSDRHPLYVARLQARVPHEPLACLHEVT
jgi:hypothetical protein